MHLQSLNCRLAGIDDRNSGRRLVLFSLLLTIDLLSGRGLHGDEKPISGSIALEDTFVRIKDAAELPALERGRLKDITCEPGTGVHGSQTVAVLDDVEATLSLELAQLDLAIAEKLHQDSVAIPIATATLEEARLLLEQARLESEAVKAIAETDIGVRQATKDSELSQAELDRSLEIKKEFSSSVSAQQLARLTLMRDQDLLKLEKARHEQTVDRLRSRGKESLVAQQNVSVQRLEHSLKEAESDHEIAGLKIQSLRKAVAIAEERLARRSVRAPFSGMVVEKLRNAGEWVEAGDPVLRVLRLDVLYVEGFLTTKLASPGLRGRSVHVVCEVAGTSREFEGKIVFVSPEVESGDHRVLVRAEISNPKLDLGPGQPAQMWILPQ